jgi:hypothetical protein
MLDCQKNNTGRSADEVLRDVADVLDFKDCKSFLKVSDSCTQDKTSWSFLKF